MSIFRPKQLLKHYSEFEPTQYRSAGFNTLLIDVDNTIDIPDSPLCGSKEAFDFLKKCEDAGFKVIIVSNNTKKRIIRFLNGKHYDYFYWSFKPLPFIYYHIIKKYHLDHTKVIMLGDQILTDCIGANLAGIYAIYTKQLIEKDIVKTRFNRKIERFIFKHILHEEV